MSDNKRYYWLKLNEDFFEDDTIEWIEEQEGGEKYVLFYLKLCVKSIKNEGHLIRYVGDTLMPYDVKALAKLTNTDKDTVAVALKAFEEIGLIERKDTGEIYMKQIDEMIGTETDTAKRVRRHRAKQKALEETSQMLQCNTVETKSNTEKEKEKEKEIEKEKEKEKETVRGVIEKFSNHNDDLKNALLDFKDIRERQKSPLNVRAIKLNLTNLNKLSTSKEEQIQIINQTVMNGWKGFYPLKGKSTNNKNAEWNKMLDEWANEDDIVNEDDYI